MWARGVAVGALVAGLISACTSAADPPAAPSDAAGSTGATAPPTRLGTHDPPTRPDEVSQPLVIATSVRRPTLRLTTPQARRVITGRIGSWQQLDQPGRGIDLTRRRALPTRPLSADEVVVVPGSAVTPLVQVATVAGVDPMLDPTAYPIRVRATGPEPLVNRVRVVGDVMLGRRVGAATPDRPGAALGPMARGLAAADVTIGNLESTLSDDGRPRQGDDSFYADPRVLPALERSGFDVLSLANNHTGDFGARALRQTIRRLDGSSIGRVGAGTSARAAWRPRIVVRHGIRFGFVAFNAIGETPRATRTRPGAAEIRMQPRTGPLDRTDLQRAQTVVRRLDKRVDIVVVLPHWGEQYTNQAVPDQRVVGAALLDAGADIVVGGHPHWVQGVDVHEGKLVVNSLGNFVFDMDFSAETQQGVMVDIVSWDDRIVSTRFTPYIIGSDFAPRPLDGPIAQQILDRMWETSDPPFRR